jgi:hypothetical protein
MPPDKLRTLLKRLPADMKDSAARRAYQLMQDGALDSASIIEVIEDAVGYSLRNEKV